MTTIPFTSVLFDQASPTVFYVGKAAPGKVDADHAWSVPTSTSSNLIQRPIYETRLLDWLPTVYWSGSMTVTGTISNQKYRLVWNQLFFSIAQASLTTGWTASTNIQLTMPFINTLFSNWAATVNDWWYKWSISSNQISVNITSISNSMALTNWWLWANREVYCSSMITI